MPRSWLYHPTEGGRIFENDEVPALLSAGWYDSPGGAEKALARRYPESSPTIERPEGPTFDIRGGNPEMKRKGGWPKGKPRK